MPVTAKRGQGIVSGPSGLSGCGGGVGEDPYGLGSVSREDHSYIYSHNHSQLRSQQHQPYGSGSVPGLGLGLGLDVLDNTNEAARAMLYLQSDQPTNELGLGHLSASSSSSSSSSSAVYDRDNLTLLEHCYDDPANAWTKKGLGSGSGYDLGGEDMLAEDDTMMVLDRLRDLTTRTLHLQVGQQLFFPCINNT